MNFLAPMALAFAAALPVVILFYLLKRKRVVKLVSSTLLWQKFLAETQASAPFQRLRHNWLLLLQLLLLAAIVLALARPYFAAPTKDGRLLVVILDASASMQSADESPSRFEAARTAAVKLVDSLHENDQMVVLQAASTTQVKQSPTSAKAALRRALQSCAVTDGLTRLTESLKLAETLTRDRANSEIHLFSDGAAAGLGEFENKNLPLAYHRFGKRANNIGLVSLDVRAHPEDPTRRALYVGIANCSTNAQQTMVELRFDGQVLDARPLSLKPRETSPQVFLASQSHDGIFSVNLTTKDDLAADDQAAVVSVLPQPVKVLLVSRGNNFLEKALRACPAVQLSKATMLAEAAPAADLVVLDDIVPAVWPAGNVLAFHVANTNWIEVGPRVEMPTIVDWKNTHPLLRFVSFDNVEIGEALTVKTPSWASALVESRQTPLILAGELKRQRIIWVGFDVLQSKWPLLWSFPVFVANAVEWLNPATASASQLLVRAGDPFRFTIAHPQTNASARVRLPNGVEKTWKPDLNARELVFGDTLRQGIYHLRYGTNEVPFCVNLLDPAESDTTPRSELSLGKFSKVAATTLKRANLEFWRWLAGFALLVLLFEWWFYHRRTV